MSLSVHKEVCSFIAQFQDGDDQNITSVCQESYKNSTEKQLKLQSYLGSLNKEYAECEDNKKCMDKMSTEMKDNAKHIRQFIIKLDKIDQIGTEEAAQREAAVALAKEKALELAREKIMEKKRKIKQEIFEKKVNEAKSKALAEKLAAIANEPEKKNITSTSLAEVSASNKTTANSTDSQTAAKSSDDLKTEYTNITNAYSEQLKQKDAELQLEKQRLQELESKVKEQQDNINKPNNTFSETKMEKISAPEIGLNKTELTQIISETIDNETSEIINSTLTKLF